MIQTALDVGPVDHPLEREADRIAERVTGTSLRRAPVSARGVPAVSGGAADPAVTGAVDRLRGGGRPVPEGIRRRMEGASGADFSGVRVHVGSESDRLNESLGARAFTVGSDVFVRRAEFRPGTTAGDALLAHELTHTVQQGAVTVVPGAAVQAAPSVQRLEEPYRAPLGFREFRREKNKTKVDEYVREFEASVGAHYFVDADTKKLARIAVEKLKDTLSIIIGKELEKEDPNVDVREKAEERAKRVFFRDDATSAGQVGTDVEYEQLLKEGNVRELMTAFFNAAYYNGNRLPDTAGSVDTLQNQIISGAAERAFATTPTATVEQREELRRVGRWLRSYRRRAASSVMKMFAKDPFATGNVTALSASPWFQSFTLAASVRRRRRIGANDVRPRTPEFYAEAGTPLGGLERGFVEQHLRKKQELDEGEQLRDNQPLPWREGSVAYRRISNRWSRRVGSLGIPVQTGISATTARMLQAAKIIGLTPQQQETFLGALMAWMLPGGDHTLFEIQRGAGIARVRIDGRDPSSSRYTFVDAYQNLPGKPEIGEVRAIAGESGLPHDRLYEDAINSGGIVEHESSSFKSAHEALDEYINDPDLENFNTMYNEFMASLPPHMERTSDQGLKAYRLAAKKGRLERRKEVLDAYRDENKLSVEDFKRLLSKGNRQALTAWSGPLFPLMNDTMKYRHSWNPGKRLLGHLLFWRKVNEIVKEGYGTGAYETKMPKRLVSDQFVRANRARFGRRMKAAAEWMKYRSELPSLGRRLYAEIAWQADMAYDALQQLPKVGKESPVLAYRGEKASTSMGLRWAKRSWAKGKRLRHFLSFSRDKATADEFRKGGAGRGLLIVAKLVGKYGRDIAPFSSKIDEAEILLPSGAQLTPMREEEVAGAAAAAKVKEDEAVFVEEA
ncbi:DUF4157 domain-containing protein [Streptomyces sp. ADMS]|uniref:eCIS core domain-containing protein n=1 Tax=Streptomyces sp. ADMS TaxID=3071415 RepID=UPI00296F4E9D|nr:DUF4157 domain-containing protein [Streptomyces sp. ADMS]MDW4911263.1 DUF4157 domain-containing protein [Streptomyces sp. ADMS]